MCLCLQLAKSVGAQPAGPALAAERMQSLRLLCALTTENFRLELEAPSAPVATPARPPLLYGGVDVDARRDRTARLRDALRHRLRNGPRNEFQHGLWQPMGKRCVGPRAEA